MFHELTKQKVQVETSLAFHKQYSRFFDEYEGCLTAGQCEFERSHLAKVAKAFGQVGWTRSVNYRGNFNWQKVIDNVTVIVNNAEDCNLNDSPVPEKSWPVLLEDAEE